MTASRLSRSSRATERCHSLSMPCTVKPPGAASTEVSTMPLGRDGTGRWKAGDHRASRCSNRCSARGWTRRDSPPAPVSTSSRSQGAPITPTCGTPSLTVSSRREDTEARKRDAAAMVTNASTSTGATTSSGRAPGRRWTFLTCTSSLSNSWTPHWTSRAVKRTWPYWPTRRATSEPWTDTSVRVMVSSSPPKLIVRFLPTRKDRAASTSMENGSPGKMPGAGRPRDWAAARTRSKGHHSATAAHPGSRSWPGSMRSPR